MWWHLVSIVILDLLGFQQHAIGGLIFITLASIFSAFNHLSFDTRLPFGLYAASEHLTHHRFSKFNYGAYIQLWDRLLGTYVDWTDPPARADAGGNIASELKAM